MGTHPVDKAAEPEVGTFIQTTPRPLGSSSRGSSRDANLEAGGDGGADFPQPTEEERSTLRRVADTIPKTAFVLCVVELAERASYYGVKTVFNNYMQFPLPEGGNGAGAIAPGRHNGHAGALNKGVQFASALGQLFTFLAYLVPIFGAWIADTKLGRYKTIAIGVFIGGVAHVIMVGGAAPAVLKAGQGLAPFLISFILLAIGAGLFKPNVVPTVIDQYTHQREYVRTLPKTGERVLVCPETTIQRIMLVFYACINVGAFFAIATTYVEKYVGFWCAFLLPGILYLALPILLWAMYKKTIRNPPSGSELAQFFKITLTAVRENKGRLWARGFWDAARPSTLAAKGVVVPWSDKMVKDVGRTFVACQIFLYFPLYNVNNGGIGATSSNQGAAMTADGAPNDLLGNFNALSILVMTPIMTYGVYPLLHRHHIKFGRISRMTFGFVLAAVSGVCGALVQWRVYETSPCGYYASTCDGATMGVSPVSIWWQLPNVVLGALSEIFCNVTAYELAYARAPPHMRSIVVAFFLFTIALSSVLAIILVPAIRDPLLVWVWLGPAVALFVQTAVFYWRHRSLDEDAFMTYEDDGENAALAQAATNEATEKRQNAATP